MQNIKNKYSGSYALEEFELELISDGEKVYFFKQDGTYKSFPVRKVLNGIPLSDIVSKEDLDKEMERTSISLGKCVSEAPSDWLKRLVCSFFDEAVSDVTGKLIEKPQFPCNRTERLIEYYFSKMSVLSGEEVFFDIPEVDREHYKYYFNIIEGGAGVCNQP